MPSEGNKKWAGVKLKVVASDNNIQLEGVSKPIGDTTVRRGYIIGADTLAMKMRETLKGGLRMCRADLPKDKEFEKRCKPA